MKIKIDIDPQNEDTPVITIQAQEWSTEVEAIIRHLKELETAETAPKRLVGTDGERSVILQPQDIDFVYSTNRKVYAQTAEGILELKLKLYELEEFLGTFGFIRFSKSVIGNVDQIKRFELSFNGNLCVFFKSGAKEYVTRSYVHHLRNQLIEGGGNRDK
ncbi:LytTR family transcriptional regulator [Chryseomicrobium excrementi]|uniref:LytTR family transcriptional regulator n=1 Tax=Chryseomicrobium excrementi TaxID=2041346 RepID=A0A2M9EY51_9BACL|nr:LytTR family DNA-binding domain-containing protein [Chryseomicrobium excrementi]PJK16144.1 LytTR family transcriptional regulator [Chryseomicrobium excrementi]